MNLTSVGNETLENQGKMQIGSPERRIPVSRAKARRRTEKSRNTNSGRRSDSLGSGARIETDFAELADGTLVELVQSPERAGRTCLAVWKNREIRF